MHLVNENFSIMRYIPLSRTKIVLNLFPPFPLLTSHKHQPLRRGNESAKPFGRWNDSGISCTGEYKLRTNNGNCIDFMTTAVDTIASLHFQSLSFPFCDMTRVFSLRITTMRSSAYLHKCECKNAIRNSFSINH